MRLLAPILVLLVGLGLAGLVWRGSEPGGIDDAYALAFGRPDLGPVDFSRLARRRLPNDALACAPDVCPGAPADLSSPVFPIAGTRLREIVREVAAREPGTELVFSDRWAEQDRFVARTPLLRFPDTVDTLVVGQGEGRSTLALYSRSQIGLSDLGANRARLERWLARVGEQVARERG